MMILLPVMRVLRVRRVQIAAENLHDVEVSYNQLRERQPILFTVNVINVSAQLESILRFHYGVRLRVCN